MLIERVSMSKGRRGAAVRALCAGVLAAGLLMSSMPAGAAESTAANEWKFDGNIYLWAPSLNVGLQNGGEVEIDFNTILEDLDMVFMAGAGASKGKWSFRADVIYFKISDDVSAVKSIPGPIAGRHTLNVGLSANVTMKSWVVTPAAAYNLIDTEKGSLNVLGGARYLYIKVPVNLTTTVGPITRSDSLSPSGSNWDGIVGVRGRVNLAPKWFAPYYLDVGAGDSKSTWQGFAGVGYQFEKVDAIAGYRYLNYKFKDGAQLDDLTVKGPLIGIAWVF